MKRLLLLTLAFGFFTTAAFAHNGMIHLMGTVKSITDKQVTVEGTDGRIQTVVFTSTTSFLRGQTAIAAKDIKVGDHTVIHARKAGDQLLAAEVKIGSTKNGAAGGVSGLRAEHAPQ